MRMIYILLLIIILIIGASSHSFHRMTHVSAPHEAEQRGEVPLIRRSEGR
jgi:hypothetical protein